MKKLWRSTVRMKGRVRKRAAWLFALACIAVLILAAGLGLLRGHAQASFPLPAIEPPGAKAAQAPPPAANQNQRANNQPTGTTVEDARKQEIASECADLLKMATDLKTEVDKSNKDMLSVTVVRKAGDIEQLAHKVRAANGKS